MPQTQGHRDDNCDSSPLRKMLSSNEAWAEERRKSNPTCFERMAAGQSPHTLWIGCADSRVPESIITNSQPGEIFVHRNIANQVHLHDDNTLSVIEYAVNHLGVRHIVVVGHSNCGGAAASLAAATSPEVSCCAQNGSNCLQTIPTLPPDNPINKWLQQLTKLAFSLGISTAPKDEALSLLIEENVKGQVENLSKLEVIRDAWQNAEAQGKELWIHGWVYEIETGLLSDLNISRGPSAA
ncbi:hypothetical protein NLJ89_g4316 [Agrocybe chaxingu]|uniref:Carbonic anhydrase n=1 Tax=Agrocybe chaxingu TaxID=84603 RepID=A0A9W8MUN6_9AGAR|nr:hypothetical protein NLJ89_g4316 [Agrocybe chaxingu]